MGAATSTGCDPTPVSSDAPAETDETQLVAPMPPLRFADSSDEQIAMRQAAIDALEAGDEDVALTALLALVRSDPPSEVRAIGGLLLAQLYHRRDEIDRSLEVLEDLRRTAPPSAEFSFVYGTTLVDADRPADAAIALLRATRLDPEYVRAYPTLAALQASLGQEDEARGTLLSLERQFVRFARELETGPPLERKLQILRRLRVGYPHADAARAAAIGLTDAHEEVVNEALRTLERVGTVDVDAALERLAESESPLAERAAEVRRSIATRGN